METGFKNWSSALRLIFTNENHGTLILIYHKVVKNARARIELTIIKYFSMAMRFNAFLIGAVGVERVMGGAQSYFVDIM